MKLLQTNTYLLLIDEEAEIQKGDLMYDNHLVGLCNCTKVVNKLPYSYTSSFINVDKVIAYYPLNKEAKELDLPLLPSFEVTKSIEHLAEEKADVECQIDSSLDYAGFYKGFIEGYKAAQSKQFSLEDIKTVIKWLNKNYSLIEDELFEPYIGKEDEVPDVFFHSVYEEALNRGIQSLSTQRLPKEFEPIMYPKYTQYDGFEEDDEIPVMTPMTSTNSEGKQEIQGKYIW
jgi:hypothetical protein